MALSDCMHCWNTPCICGWDYRHLTLEQLQRRVGMFALMIAFKTRNPNAKFSTLSSEKQTEDDKRWMEFIGAWEKE